MARGGLSGVTDTLCETDSPCIGLIVGKSHVSAIHSPKTTLSSVPKGHFHPLRRKKSRKPLAVGNAHLWDVGLWNE